nr:GIY-YIG nuclease domain containing protein [Marseillevirus futianmevirus]
MSGEFVYLVSCPHYAKNVFKVGRTSSPSSRKKAYGSSAEFIRFEKVTDSKVAELYLIRRLSALFERVNGKEFFIGDKREMELSFDNNIARWRTREHLPKNTDDLEAWWGIHTEEFRLPFHEYTFVLPHHNLWTYSPDIHPGQTFVVLEETVKLKKEYARGKEMGFRGSRFLRRIGKLPKNDVFIDFGGKCVFKVLSVQKDHVRVRTLDLFEAFPSLRSGDDART